MKQIFNRSLGILSILLISAFFFPGNCLGGVDTKQVDFGQVLVGSRATAGLKIFNQDSISYNLYLNLDQSGSPFSADYTTPIPLAPGETKEIQLAYTPEIPGQDSYVLKITYGAGWSVAGTEQVHLLGEGVEEIVPKTLILNGEDTGVLDQLYGDQPISAWIEECKVNARNQGQFVKCVFLLTNRLKKADIITAKEKRLIRRQLIAGLVKENKKKPRRHHSWKKHWKEKHRDAEYRKMKKWFASR